MGSRRFTKDRLLLELEKCISISESGDLASEADLHSGELAVEWRKRKSWASDFDLFREAFGFMQIFICESGLHMTYTF